MTDLILAQTLIAGLVSSFQVVCTPQLFKYFTSYVLGLMVLPGRKTVNALACASGLAVHPHNFHRFITEYPWADQQLPELLAKLVFRVLGIQPGADGRYELFAVTDDTVVEHTAAKKMYGVSNHRDPLARPKEVKYVRGHNWVLLGLLWPLSNGQWLFFALGALLYVSLKVLPAGQVFYTKLALGVALVEQVAWPSWVHLTVVADNGYDRKTFVLNLLAVGRDIVTRLRRDAAVYAVPEPPAQRKRGRPRQYGARLYLNQLVKQADLFAPLEVFIYGRLVTLQVARLDVMIKRLKRKVVLVIIRGDDQYPPVFLYTTNLTLSTRLIIELYAARFKIELAIRDMKQHVGLSDYQVRSRTGIGRHVSLVVVAYTLLQLLPLIQAEGVSPLLPRWSDATIPYPSLGQIRWQLQMAVWGELIFALVGGLGLPCSKSALLTALQHGFQAETETPLPAPTP